MRFQTQHLKEIRCKPSTGSKITSLSKKAYPTLGSLLVNIQLFPLAAIGALGKLSALEW
jgi:hypothetical protein